MNFEMTNCISNSSSRLVSNDANCDNENVISAVRTTHPTLLPYIIGRLHTEILVPWSSMNSAGVI